MRPEFSGSSFEAALLPLLVSAALCFALEYSGLGKWLTRRTVVLLAVMPLVYMLLILTNEVHHLVWTRSGLRVMCMLTSDR